MTRNRATSPSSAPRILVVDDDEVISRALGSSLQRRGFIVDYASSWSAVRARHDAFAPHAIVMDHLLGDGEGVELLADLRGFAPNVPVVILTGHGSIDLAVQAMRSGAEHFLTKPIDPDALERVLRSIVEPRRESEGRLASGARPRLQASPRRRGIDPFIGESDAIQRLRDQAERMREGDRPVLILGETGTGKSVLARWLHATGDRASAAFVDLNCAALSRELLDSELFGHERGAFTGAQATKMGLLEAADRGMLFLDEIGDMDMSIQPKLLKALEERKFRRLGDVRDRSVDVRLVSATHVDLGAAVRNKQFRADLYYRISALRLTMPSLRQRREDIPRLAADLLDRLCLDLARPEVELTRAAESALVAYDWPGNVRELKNVLDRALCMTEGDVIDATDLVFDDFEHVPEPSRDSASRITLKEVESQMIERVLREEGGRVEAAARRLGVPRSSLYYKLKTLGWKPSR